MALVFGDNISYQGKKPLDARFLFTTKAEMKSYSENYLPSLAFCQNEEDGQFYVYDVKNTVDAALGKWRLFKSGSSEAYTLPTASATTLGGIKIGENLSISEDGVVSATDTNTTYSEATTSTAGLMSAADKTKLDGLENSEPYTLPTASSSVLGGIKVGENLSISEDGTLNATSSGGSDYTLPTASSSVLGGIKVGENLTISDDGTLNAISSGGSNYTLPTASSSVLGGIKVGENLSIDGDGKLSASLSTDDCVKYSDLDVILNAEIFTDGTDASGKDYVIGQVYHYQGETTSDLTKGEYYVYMEQINVTHSVSKNQTWEYKNTSNIPLILKVTNTCTNGGDYCTFIYINNQKVSEVYPYHPVYEGTLPVGQTLSFGCQANGSSDILIKSPNSWQGLDYDTYTKSKIASSDNLGLVKVGDGLVISEDGTLNATSSGGSDYTLPTASSSVLGGIKVGENLTISDDGTLSATGGDGDVINNITANTVAASGYELYSEDEIVIGKWVDGKPVYRKFVKKTWQEIISGHSVLQSTNTLNKTVTVSEGTYIAVVTSKGRVYDSSIDIKNGETLYTDYISTGDDNEHNSIRVAIIKMENNSRISLTANALTGNGNSTAVSYYVYAISNYDSDAVFSTLDKKSSYLQSYFSPTTTVSSQNVIYIGSFATNTPNTPLKLECTADKTFETNYVDNNYISYYSKIGFATKQDDDFDIKVSCACTTYDRNCYMVLALPDTSESVLNIDVVVDEKGPNKSILEYTKTTDEPNSFTADMLDSITISGGSNYTLPTASSSVLGGIKVGENLSIDENGVLSATDTNTIYSPATTSTDGLMSAADKTKLDGLENREPYMLPKASASTLGGVKVGENLSIDGDGVLSSSSNINVSGTVRSLPNTSEIFSYNYEEIFSSSTGQGSPNNVFANNKYAYLINWQPASGDAEPYVGIKIAEGRVLTSAQIWMWSNSPAASSIEVWIEGSTDGETWTTLTTPTAISDGSKLPIIGLNKKFTRFRLRTNLNFRDTCGADRYNIGTLELSGIGGSFIETKEDLSLETLELNSDFYINNGVVCLAKENLGGDSDYILPTASSSVLGGIKVGENLTISDDGTLNATASGGSDYTLPTASSSVLGGIKVGENLSIDGNGVLSATDTNTIYSPATTSTDGLMSAADKTKLDGLENREPYMLPKASNSVLGGIIVGDNLTIDENGVLSATASSSSSGGSDYILPAASTSTLGGIKVGTGLAITEDGTLSTTGGSTGSSGDYNVENLTLNGIDEYSEDEIVIGKWIDGKPVYRRTIYVQNVSNNGGNTNLCTIPNLGLLLNSKINSIKRTDASNNNWGKAEFYITGSDFLSSIISATGDNVTIVFKWNNGSYSDAYVTLEYTKTTDEPNSFTPSMLPNITVSGSSSSGGSSNVYSDGETVIGTWVDEKPIYRDVSLLALGNLVPVLTGESSKVICNNSPYPGNAAWMAFDDKISTTYDSPDNPGVIYLGYRFDEPQLVLKYALTATDPTSVRNWPTDFKLQGSNDEITWDTLDEQVGFVGFDSSSGPHEFDVNNSTYYKAYRIEVTKRGSGGTGVGGLARLEFHGYKDMVPPENTDIIFRQESFSNYQVYEYTKTTD